MLKHLPFHNVYADRLPRPDPMSNAPLRPHDLVTIVFPDRATQQAAMSDAVIGGKLLGARLSVNVYHVDEISEL